MPPGPSWREVTLDWPVSQAWAGGEPMFAWEAKAYTLA
jgi:hypothetical protein